MIRKIMSRTVLITYASRNGSTIGVAEAVRDQLQEGETKIDLLPMEEVYDTSSYHAIIAGSAIQSGAWLPEAIEFMKVHRESLLKRQFFAFSVCMTLAMPAGGKYRNAVASWMEPVCKLVPPLSIGIFAGALDIKKIPSAAARFKFRLSVLFGVWKEGDHRDWILIRQWTDSLKTVLN
jgi:menaquinone-dependent protoporphyrinogen oxidase